MFISGTVKPETRRKSAVAFHRISLFISGASPRSQTAVALLRRVCDRHLAGRHELSVIDVYQQPRLANDSSVVAVPTLIIATDQSERRIVGPLDEAQILNGLAIK